MKKYVKASSDISFESVKKALTLMDDYDLVELYEGVTGDYLTDDYDEDTDIEIIAEDIPISILADKILKLKYDEDINADDAYDLIREVQFMI